MGHLAEELEKCRGTGTYDHELMKIRLSFEPRPFFGELHTELLPYIGQEYEETKILLIAESHYVEKATQDQFENTNWYHSPLPQAPMSDDKNNPFHIQGNDGAEGWFDTRQVLVRYMNNDRGKGHTVFSNPTKVLNELGIGIEDGDKAFDRFAFMNFFQRPALEKGKSINDSPIDRKAAKEILSKVIDILQPKAVIFLSKKAYNAFGEKVYNGIPIYKVCHPTCPWWNRKCKDGKCAKEHFKDILKDIV